MEQVMENTDHQIRGTVTGVFASWVSPLAFCIQVGLESSSPLQFTNKTLSEYLA